MHFKIYSSTPNTYHEADYLLVYEHEDGSWKRAVRLDDIAKAPATSGTKFISVPILNKYRRRRNSRQANAYKQRYNVLVFDSQRVERDVLENEIYYKSLAVKRYSYYKELEQRLSKYEDVPHNPTV